MHHLASILRVRLMSSLAPLIFIPKIHLQTRKRLRHDRHFLQACKNTNPFCTRHLLRAKCSSAAKTAPLQPPAPRRYDLFKFVSCSVDFFTSPSRYPRNKRVSQAAIVVVVVVGTDLFLCTTKIGTMTHGPQSKQSEILIFRLL